MDGFHCIELAHESSGLCDENQKSTATGLSLIRQSYLSIMKISEICKAIEAVAPLSLQEDYDNAGMLVGYSDNECTGVVCTLDVSEAVVEEAVARGCNLVLAHHPIIFRGLKRITGATHVERVIIKALKNDIAIYAAHTNLDNVLHGVNAKIADLLQVRNRKPLVYKQGVLQKLYTFVPPEHVEQVRNSLFAAGAGMISNYSECSFTHEGTGTFKPGPGSQPYSGSQGLRQNEREIKIEIIMPRYIKEKVLAALLHAHPYEEVAYDVVDLANTHQGTGSGLVGQIDPLEESRLLQKLQVFNRNVIRHSPLTGRQVKTVAICGGAGSFLTSSALSAGADAFITADLKYHEFFDAEGRLLLCDIGHFESEQYTIDLMVEILLQKFPNFAVLKSEIETNPVHYFTGKQK